MTTSAIVALLQSALALLSLAQSTPSLPQSFRDNAITVAQRAISQTAGALGTSAAPTTTNSTQASQGSDVHPAEDLDTTNTASLGDFIDGCQIITLTDTAGLPVVGAEVKVSGTRITPDLTVYNPSKTLTTDSRGEVRYCYSSTKYEISSGKLWVTVTFVPKVLVTAARSPVEYGGTTTISWAAKEATSCTMNSSPILLTPSGSMTTESLTKSTTFTFACGQDTGSATVDVKPWTPPAGVKLLPPGQCTQSTAPCTTGPDGFYCIKDGNSVDCGA